MGRGGRRRSRGRGRQSGAPTAERQAKPARPSGEHAQPAQREGAARRRRKRRSGAAPEQGPSAIDQMSGRPKALQTLPPDGLVLEDVIAGMQSEYGPPSTPQEYRLIIRLPGEEAKERAQRAERAERERAAKAAAGRGASSAEAAKDGGTSKRGRLRRRRRRRGPPDAGGESGGGEPAGGAAATGPGGPGE